MQTHKVCFRCVTGIICNYQNLNNYRKTILSYPNTAASLNMQTASCAVNQLPPESQVAAVNISSPLYFAKFVLKDRGMNRCDSVVWQHYRNTELGNGLSCSQYYHEEFKGVLNCLIHAVLCQFITEPFNKVVSEGIQFGNCYSREWTLICWRRLLVPSSACFNEEEGGRQNCLSSPAKGQSISNLQWGCRQ